MPTLSAALNALATATDPDSTIVLESGTAKKIDYSAGGGAASVVPKTADFTANDVSGTIYTNTGASGTVVGIIAEGLAIGTEYTFAVTEEFNFAIVFPDGDAVAGMGVYDGNATGFWSFTGDGSSSLGADVVGHFINAKKIATSIWLIFTAGFTA